MHQSLDQLLTPERTYTRKIKEMFPLVCNFGLFIFLAIGSADHFIEQRLQLQYLQDLAFGAICFWIVPGLVLKARSDSAARS